MPTFRALWGIAGAVLPDIADGAYSLLQQLVEDALKLYEDAERDGDLLRAEIGRLTQELEARDSIEIQAQQLKRLMGTERYAWLITGILGGAITGFVVAPNK